MHVMWSYLIAQFMKERELMEEPVLERPAPDRQGVALKAFARIADAWSLTLREAAALADMSESTWKRARKPGFAGGSDARPDAAPERAGRSLQVARALLQRADLAGLGEAAQPGPRIRRRAAPLDAMVAGGLPKILRVRGYVDALRGGV